MQAKITLFNPKSGSKITLFNPGKQKRCIEHVGWLCCAHFGIDSLIDHQEGGCPHPLPRLRHCEVTTFSSFRKIRAETEKGGEKPLGASLRLSWSCRLGITRLQGLQLRELQLQGLQLQGLQLRERLRQRGLRSCGCDECGSSWWRLLFWLREELRCSQRVQ